MVDFDIRNLFGLSLDPLTMLTTPGGRPRSCRYLVSRSDAEGAFSVGLSTYVLPVAIANGYIHSAIIAGKLNGAMYCIGLVSTVHEVGFMRTNQTEGMLSFEQEDFQLTNTSTHSQRNTIRNSIQATR